MGITTSTFRPITIARCSNCSMLNFPGCGRHGRLLAASYGGDGLHTRCSGPRCVVNTAKCKFSCAGCKAQLQDFYRVTISSVEIQRGHTALAQYCSSLRSSLKKVADFRFSTCLLICGHCSAAMFPIIERNLCSVNAAGQLVDDSGRSVNVDSWKRHFVHCHDKCPGLSNPPGFLLRIDTKLMLSELLFAKNKSISVAPGRWADFKYPTLSAVQAPAPSPSSATPVRQPSVASPPIPQASPLLVDLNQTFPIALGVCTSCGSVNFPGCSKHGFMLSKPYEIVDNQGKVTYAGCPGEGCEVNTRFSNLPCVNCKRKEWNWHHVVLTNKETGLLEAGWLGRGLGLAPSYNLMHTVLKCQHCLCIQFPSIDSKLCESRQRTPSYIPQFKDAHTHVRGCPGTYQADALVAIDTTLNGAEVGYLLGRMKEQMQQNIRSSSSPGHWNQALLQQQNPQQGGQTTFFPSPPPLSAPASAQAPYPYMPLDMSSGSGQYPSYPYLPQPQPDSAYPFAAYASSGSIPPMVPQMGGPAPYPTMMGSLRPPHEGPMPAQLAMMGNPMSLPSYESCVAPPDFAASPSAPPVDDAGHHGSDEGKSCVVCLVQKRDVIFYRCGHLAVCGGCAQQLRNQQKGCPICRQPILDVVKVFSA